jgi:hemolysin III
MSVSHPYGLSRRVNRAVLTATLAFGGAAFVTLAVLAFATGARGFTAASLVYGGSLAACALCSFLYQMLETVRWRDLLRYLDHSAIFLLIAGTYTPFAAAGIHGPFNGSLLAWVWGLALVGIVLKLVLPRAHDRAFVLVYLAMGWIFVTSAGEVFHNIPALPLAFLALGGAAYTVGALIFARDIGRWTDPVWHGCVLAGIVAHFLAVITFCLSPEMVALV